MQFVRKALIATIAIFLVLSVFASCNRSGASALVGRWKNVAPSYGYLVDMDLLSDGTCMSGGHSLKWRVENGRLYLMGWYNHTFTYERSGKNLTLTRTDGVVQMFVKQ